MRRIILQITVFSIIFAALAGAQSKRVSFPSQHLSVISPDGRFAIINLDSDKAPYHTLSLDDRKNHVKRKLLEYNRSVDVLWNPDSSSFAVTDHMGSNISECYLYSTDLGRPKIDIQGEILARMKTPRERASVQNNDHVYWEAVRWLNSTTLRVKIWGHGDENPAGFARYYTYRLLPKH